MKTRILTCLVAIAAILFSSSLFISCQSPEEKVISLLESLCKTVEKDSFTVDQMDTIQDKFKEVNEAAKTCKFTDEQLKEVTKLKVRFSKGVVKKAADRVGSAVDGFIEDLSAN